ncbi:MAG: phasin family protein [Xanthobacteraceae bacterium]|nr:phasin family protein [Xanthobacteraceae bacterium]
MVLKSDPFSFSPTAYSSAGLAEMSEGMRAMAESGLQQAREGYEKLREAAQSGNGALEAACQTAARGAGDYTAMLLQIARTNVEGSFDFVHALLGSKSVAEAVGVTSDHARRQFELLASQSSDLLELGQKVATDTVEPIKASAAWTFNT